MMINTREQQRLELVRLHREEKMPVTQAAEVLGIPKNTAYRWMKKDGPNNIRKTDEERTKSCRWCKESFIPSRPEGVFCSRECANDWIRWETSSATFCPCGKRVEVAKDKKFKSSTKKYCSAECISRFGKKKQPDPSNYVTFNCLNCNKEVTRYKKYGKGHSKYCSNTCAQKHTKVRKFYTVENFEIVFESSYEALFWGLCMIAKIPIERFNREYGTKWGTGTKSWYAPDFWLTTINTAVEVKGVKDEDDDIKWEAFRSAYPNFRLAIFTAEELRLMSPKSLLEWVNSWVGLPR